MVDIPKRTISGRQPSVWPSGKTKSKSIWFSASALALAALDMFLFILDLTWWEKSMVLFVATCLLVLATIKSPLMTRSSGLGKLIISICVFCTGILISFPTVKNQYSKDHASTPSAVLPYINVSISIEPGHDPTLEVFWMHIENGPNIPIHNVRFALHSEEFSGRETETPSVRDLNPNGKIDNPTISVPLRIPHPYDVFVDVYFDAEQSGVTKHFIAMTRFILPSGYVSHQKINPSESEMKEGIMDKALSINNTYEAIMKPEGTIFLVLPEKNDSGHWNNVTIGTPARYIDFNPQSHTFSFHMVTTTGRIVFLYFIMERYSKEKHVLTVAWNNYGADIGIDGAFQQDYDAGHAPK